MTVAVELARTIDGPEVIEVLAGCGLDGELIEDGFLLRVEADDDEAVVHCLDEWINRHGLPFVPLRVDEHVYALVPPAG
jgi:hypothetical protein